MFHHRERRARTPAHETALDCLEAGITAALPKEVVSSTVDLDGKTFAVGDAAYDLDEYDRLLVLGGGKASGGFAAALADRLGSRLDGGAVVTTNVDTAAAGPIDVREGDHPTPTERNVQATAEILERAGSATGETLVLAIVTGGASALWCAPATDLTLSDLQRTTDALLASGASIDEINAVRKHCSAIKGGQLARAAAPATVVTLAISDVVGDDPSVIGSGPTVPDASTFGDALAVLDRYDIRDSVPESVVDRLERGADGELAETPDENDPAVAENEGDWHCLANGRTAIDAARDVARERGYEPLVLSSRLGGEASEVGRVHAGVAAEIAAGGDPVERPAIVLSGGEVTVTVDGDGTGGPNQELALATALELADTGTDAILASVDTDGIDGPTDAAGAIVDRESIPPDESETARRALAENDVYDALDDRSALLRTGYTGTNVNDLRVLVVPAAD
ncbi:glycerate kinase type-2 family protein [Halosolutus halophilus]|uniref:glycerate kinase type-2 family protein n=1 Tax=Halosolutus halophilus TaxID=1552990 RepID=UPI002234FDD0|nr:DUF4147 domain-containing protein [Halosolutus halophilus]